MIKTGYRADNAIYNQADDMSDDDDDDLTPKFVIFVNFPKIKGNRQLGSIDIFRPIFRHFHFRLIISCFNWQN